MTDSPAAKPNDEVDTNTASAVNQWDRFWFADGSVQAAARLRALLCVITAAYFISALLDVSTWLVATAPFSTDRTGTFLQAAGLQSDARWMISPLFLLDSLLGSHVVVYYAYLLIGVALCVLVSLGRGGKAMPWLLWLVFVGWANRLVILAGISETLLSMGLFAAAIAPPASWRGDARSDWKAGFSLRLTAAQITLFAACTTATMLAGRVWWNGLGAYALVAPVEDRTLAVGGDGSVFATSVIHDTLTHLLVLALPVGIVLAWIRPRSWAGPIIVAGWCAAVAMLGSHWLYGITFAAMTLAIRQTGERENLSAFGKGAGTHRT